MLRTPGLATGVTGLAFPHGMRTHGQPGGVRQVIVLQPLQTA